MRLYLPKVIGKTLLVMVILVAVQISGEACVCIKDDKTPLQEKESPSFVFIGKVIGREQESQFLLTSQFPFVHRIYGQWKLKFEVKEVWKGDLERELITSDFSNSCSEYFAIGKEYLVYSYSKTLNELHTACTRTTKLTSTSAQEDLDSLGKGRIPELRERRGFSSLLPISILLLSFFLPAFFVWISKRRRLA